MKGGENPSWIANKYNELVANYLTSISYGISHTQRWRVQGDAHANPLLVTFNLTDGTHVKFDLSFQFVNDRVGVVRTMLMVETKASYDISYVTKGFRKFLEDVLAAVTHSEKRPGEQYLFAFVSPITIPICTDPRIFSTTSGIISLYKQMIKEDLKASIADALRGRIFAIIVAIEQTEMYGGVT